MWCDVMERRKIRISFHCITLLSITFFPMRYFTAMLCLIHQRLQNSTSNIGRIFLLFKLLSDTVYILIGEFWFSLKQVSYRLYSPRCLLTYSSNTTELSLIKLQVMLRSAHVALVKVHLLCIENYNLILKFDMWMAQQRLELHVLITKHYNKCTLTSALGAR